MSLPGKLCIGILEEDNPLRSYFRFKPILLDEGGSYAPYEESGTYPDEGCIRIVPDKNESYHFKARMRQTGLFCVVDLREHPNDNDKIRPNKNYRPEGEEINACIIYSDVVRAPAPGMIFEVLPASAAEGTVKVPSTTMVLLEKEGTVGPTCYTWEAAEGEGMATLRGTPAECPTEGLQVFELKGFRDEMIRFAIRSAASMGAVSDMPEKAEPEKPAPEKSAPEKPIPEKAPEKPEPEKPESPVEKPEPEKPAPVPEKKPEPSRAPEPESEKPWIHHDASMLPKPVDHRLSRSEQLRAAQAGLNPRRGRSLQELIDEKWQQSRLNQLGMPVSPIATGAPVRNPLDAAVEALKEVWSQPSLRKPLMEALGQVDYFTDSLRKFREQVGKDLIQEQLNGLEAQRLQMLGELDKLKAGGRDIREQLKQEIRQDEASDLAEAVKKTRDAQAQQSKYEKLASEAREAARDAQSLLDHLVGDQLEQTVREVALVRRVEERMTQLRGGSAEEPVLPDPEKIGARAFIERLTQCFAAEGWALSPLDAANLCVCLALSPTLILSGAPGSGKTTAARVLTTALGLEDAGRVVMCAPDPKPLWGDSRVEQLRKGNAPAVVILDDANLAPAPDALRGLGQGFGPEWRTIVTVQDAHSGVPLSAAALDQGFMVRLSIPEDLPWRPASRQPMPAFSMVSIEAIRASLPQSDVPAALVERMEALRKAMARRKVHISRRALNDAWRYCSVMLALLGKDADAIFDLAVAQRIMPGVLASAPIEAVMDFRRATEKQPACRDLLRQPLPIRIE